MSTIWKVVIGLVLTLPIAAYVVGSLVASTAEPPGQREPVVIQNRSPSPTTPPHNPSREPSDPRPSGSNTAQGDDEVDDGVEDNGLRIVNPEPTRVDDDDDGRDDDDRNDDDGDDEGGDDGGDDDTDDGGDD